MTELNAPEPADDNSGIGLALLCNDQGTPVVSEFTEDDTWNLIQIQDAEEEPMLRPAA